MLLGFHSYCLYLNGVDRYGTNSLPWQRKMSTFELLDYAASLKVDGLQIGDGVYESLDTGYLKDVRSKADELGLFIEYNFSLNMGNCGTGEEHDLKKSIEYAGILGCDVVKLGMDLVRPRPIAGSKFDPRVMEMLKEAVCIISKGIGPAQEIGARLAVENHCDTYSDEILWLLDEIDDETVGACIDTSNPIFVMEDPVEAVTKLAPRSYTNHFRDDAMCFGVPWGFTYQGAVVGSGDVNMKKMYEIIRKTSSMRRIIIETDMRLPMEAEDEQQTTRLEREALEKSIAYCRDVLGIQRESEDGENGRPW